MSDRADSVGRISLLALSAGTTGITSAWGEALAEAAIVCLDSQSHQSGVVIAVDGHYEGRYALLWDKCTDQMRRCWADLDEAVEHGAYCVSALLLMQFADLIVLERSVKGTGFDYWLGHEEDEQEPLFQRKARLEVSGIRRGNASDVDYRLRTRMRQTRRSDRTGLPAYIVVVEFGKPCSKVAARCVT